MRAILVQHLDGRFVTSVFENEENLISAMEARGYGFEGIENSRRLRPELQGAPKFKGLVGPCWGGEQTPWRYEDPQAYAIICSD